MKPGPIRLVSLTGSDNGGQVSFTVRIGDQTREIFFRSAPGMLTASANTVAIACLWPGMRLGRDLEIEAPLSPALVASLDRLQQIYCAWQPGCSRISVHGPTAIVPDKPSGGRVASFFSGGVDSFHTLLKHQDEITDLVFVHGLDIQLEDRELRDRSSTMIRSVGSELGKQVVEIETNLLSLLKPYVPYLVGYGAALAAIGHLLSPAPHRLYVASQHPYSDLRPCGSHPLTDPLWSSERVEFLHDGAEATRVEKVESIAGHAIALRTLRVCWETTGEYNCGHCEKCLRTMLNLAAVGALDRCRTFTTPLSPAAVSMLSPRNAIERSYFEENLRELRARGADPALVRTLDQALQPRRPWRKFVNSTGLFRRDPSRALRSVRRRLFTRRRRQPQEILELLRDAEVRRNAGEPMADICRALGISEADYRSWRDKYRF